MALAPSAWGALLQVGTGYAYPSISAALAAAGAGDTIQVAPGTYSGDSGETFPLRLTAAISLQALDPSVRPVLRGDGTNTVVLIEVPDVTLSGFEVTGGRGSSGLYLMDGGGICIFVGADAAGQVTIRDCLIYGNTCPTDETYDGCGGGIYCGGAYCTCFKINISDCIISGNKVRGNGGGVFAGLLSDVRIENSLVTGNSADDRGGGVAVDNYGRLNLQNCQILTNRAVGDPLKADWGGKGGGVFCNGNGVLTLADSAVVSNYARYYGGGVFSMSAITGTVTACRLAYNHADIAGGGAYLRDQSALAFFRSALYWNDAGLDGGGVFVAGTSRSGGSVTLADNTSLEGNEAQRGCGGGVFLDSHARAACSNVQYVGNASFGDGGGLYASPGAVATLTNCLLVYNGAARGRGAALCGEAGVSVELNHCTVVGNAAAWDRSGLYLRGDASVLVTDSILWRNAGGSVSTNGSGFAIAHSLCEDGSIEGVGVIHGSPGYVAWGASDALYVDASAPGPGLGTAASPYRDLQIALTNFDLRLGAGSPCTGRAGNGTDLGANTGRGGQPGTVTAVVNLAAGPYDIRGRNITMANGLRGAGSASTIVRNAVLGHITPATLADFAVTGEADFGGLLTRTNVTLAGCRIFGNACHGDGGGFYAAEGAATLTNTVIESNDSASRGGGLYLADQLSLVMAASSLGDNQAGSEGGGGYLGTHTRTRVGLVSTVSGNSSATQGGGLYALASDWLQIDASTVSQNSSAWAGGGLAAGGTVFIFFSCIASNVAHSYGGGAYLTGTATISNSVFSANRTEPGNAPRGGGVYVAGSANVSILASLFDSNTALTYGGALACRGQTFVRDSQFLNNYARNYDGGGVHADHTGTLLFTNCVFGGNQAARWGGGVHATPSTRPRFEACVFTNNWAANGGAAAAEAASVPVFLSCAFASNACALYGGGFWGSSAAALFQTCTFTNGRATYGGDVCSDNADASRFIACTFAGGAAQAGGSFHLRQTAHPTLANCRITGAYASEYGGGLASYNQAAGHFEDNVIDSCRSVYGGGGAYGCDNATNFFLRCTFRGNQVASPSYSADGGGAFFTDNAQLQLQCCRLQSNTAEDDGGGLSLAGSAGVVASNVFIVQNTGVNAGGGVHFYNTSRGRFSNCTIASNRAEYSNGGGIYLETGCTIDLDSCIVSANTPDDIRPSSTPNVIYSCTGQDWPGSGNTTSAPLLDVTFVPLAGSPCIDGGNPAPAMNDGSRPPGQGTERNDMGATGGPLNGWLPPVDDCRLDHPAGTSILAGEPTEWIYGRIRVIGLTEAPDGLPDVEGQAGLGLPGTAPATWTNWWPGTFDVDVADGSDQYAARLVPPAAGVYAYAWRFRRAAGPWMYADLDGATNGVSTNQLGVLWAWSASDPRIDYPTFDSTTDLVLVGSAVQTNRLLRLTSTIANAPGGVWYRQRYPVATGFEAFFEFRIEYHGGSGLAFVIQNNATNALGSGGPSMGYTFANGVAVEFDTYPSGTSDYPNGNHVSVQTRGTTANNSSHAYSLGAASALRNMSDNRAHFARISYRPGTLRVYLDDFSTPLLVVSVDLQALLALTEGHGWLGFTAANGTVTSIHDLYSWTVGRAAIPVNNDADGDGMPDWWENWWFAGPTNGLAGADVDGDALANLGEYQAGSNPAQADTDADGLRDGDEVAAGTSPTNGASCLRLTGLTRVGADRVRVDWDAVGNHAYQVQVLTNLFGGGVSNIGPVIVMPAGGETTTNSDHEAPPGASRYYRVRLVP